MIGDSQRSLGEIEMPPSLFNPARVALDPNDPDYLKKMGMVGAAEGAHEVGQGIKDKAQAPPMAAPGAPPSMPTDPFAESRATFAAPTGTERLMQKAEGIKRKPLRVLGEIGAGLATGAEAAGEALFPTIAEQIPGTFAHREMMGTQQFGREMAEQKEREIEESKRQTAAIQQERADIAKAGEARQEKESGLVTVTLPDGSTAQVEQKNLGQVTAAKTADIGKTERSQANIQEKQRQLDQQYKEFQQADQTKRYIADLNARTKERVAKLTADKAPAAMLQTAEFATGGLNQLASAQTAMQQLEEANVMGTLPANWIEDYLFGHGAVDPNLDANTRRAIGQLRAALTYTSSAAMRAHTGRTSQEIYEDFKKTLGAGQDWNALRGAMDETESMLGQYADAATTENIEKLRTVGGTGGAGGGAPAAAPSGRTIVIK